MSYIYIYIYILHFFPLEYLGNVILPVGVELRVYVMPKAVAS